MSLQGTVVIVTGAARGIGKAIAQAFLQQGAQVAAVDVLEDALEQTACELNGHRGRVLPLVTDITDGDQVAQMARHVRDTLGPVDVLVNNAGTFSVIGPVWQADPNRWLHDVQVNLGGSFLCCNAVVGDMVRRKRGCVINIVSSGGVGDPHAYSTSYASSKTGLMRLTEGLAKEVAEHGVTVFAVAPPAILTEMTRFIMQDAAGRKWRPGFENIFAEGRDVSPELVADLTVELARGRPQCLSGRYIPATACLETFVSRADEILRDDLLTLRIRSVPEA